MSNLKTIIKERDKILEDIRIIEQKFEGIDRDNKKSTYKVNEVSEYAENKILEAIKNQRWYFFKNKPKIFMDSETGLIWANLNYFKYHKNDEKMTQYDKDQVLLDLNIDGYMGWREPVPTNDFFINDEKFPFLKILIQKGDWFCNGKLCYNNKQFYAINFSAGIVNRSACTSMVDAYLLPCSDAIRSDDYMANISEYNSIYTEKEKLKFTLNLFTDNNLYPIFDDENITILYKKIYIEKPELISKLSEIQSQIDELEKENQESIISLDFDYTKILSNYDADIIDSSIIKYYKGVISWVDDLILRLDYFQNQKKDIINEFNEIGFKLSKKYENNANLSKEENLLLENRQKFLKNNLEIGMDEVIKRLLSYKKQAQDIKYRIEEINDSDEGIVKLAELEEEKRASFSLIAENTANIVMDALSKIDYFEKNKNFVSSVINLWDKWSMDYKVLKTTYKEELSNKCKEQEIEEEIWKIWFEDWCKLRYKIEQQFMPLIKEGLEGNFQTEKKGVSIIEDVIDVLQKYKEKVDAFYKNDRISIYINYALVGNSELQEKIEIQLKLYEISSEFQSELQKIIFSLDKNINKIFLLNWANNLLDLPVDEVINIIELNGLDEILEKVLNQFMELKKKNIATYLSDAKAYMKEQERRDAEFKNLVFKMKKGLAKNEVK